MHDRNSMKLFNPIAAVVIFGAIITGIIPATGYEYGKSCCRYNGKKIADCQFLQTGNKLTVKWSDGLVESYSLASQNGHTKKTYVDKRGGVWEFLLYPQGNISLTNKKNGNSIFKPLRGCID